MKDLSRIRTLDDMHDFAQLFDAEARRLREMGRLDAASEEEFRSDSWEIALNVCGRMEVIAGKLDDLIELLSPPDSAPAESPLDRMARGESPIPPGGAS